MLVRFFTKNVISGTTVGSLERLSEINEHIDELLNMNVPYGEKVKNYETLTHYLNQANIIHSNIKKSMGN